MALAMGGKTAASRGESVSATARRRMLVAVALCEHSVETLRRADALARAEGACLTVLHVLRVPELPHPAGAEGLREQRRLLWFARNAAQQALERLLEQSGLAGRVEVVVRAGDPAEVIPAEARRASAELLVLGPQHHHGLARLVFGSVVGRIRRRAPCRTLVLEDVAPRPSLSP